jgi:signal transduction histidine kinase
MKIEDLDALDLHIARARVTLSLVALGSIYIDPSIGGMFHLDRYLLATLLSHLIYSLVTYLALTRRLGPRFGRELTLALDIFFAAAVTFLTEGSTSPSYVFFVFAIVAAAFRTGFTATLTLTGGCVALYLLVIAVDEHLNGFYVMRAVYLAIAGYFIGFFGHQRARFEARLRELEAASERHAIARSLHDGYVQALASVTLRLGTCLELLQRGRAEEVRQELADLRGGIAREYDQIRAYIRSLASLDERSNGAELRSQSETRFHIEAAFNAPHDVAEQILQVMLEGLRNTVRHAGAHTGAIQVTETGGRVRMLIDDDGAGFRDPDVRPWSIASRVAECGGIMKIASAATAGAHLEIEMPVR